MLPWIHGPMLPGCILGRTVHTVEYIVSHMLCWNITLQLRYTRFMSQHHRLKDKNLSVTVNSDRIVQGGSLPYLVGSSVARYHGLKYCR